MLQTARDASCHASRTRVSSLSDLAPAGLDRADFLFSANKQVEPEELSQHCLRRRTVTR
ncbi:MAG: hypothetical protein MZV63_02435 [Marinilabiliales bacterium]|nr:hypothetical protein [Marinilabiliales bacterium]